jgi:hypothetical protein
MRRLALIMATVALLASSGTAIADTNDVATFVMHAVVTDFGPCAIDDPCPDPTVTVSAGDVFAAYLVVRNHEQVAGVQTAFDWGGSSFWFGLWDCQSNQVNGTVPGSVGGPTDGTIATAFDCITGPESAVIGRVQMMAVGGCITQVESAFPFGDHVVSCAGEVEQIPADCRGTVCVDAPGYDACALCPHSPTPAEPSTWGAIKSRY